MGLHTEINLKGVLMILKLDNMISYSNLHTSHKKASHPKLLLAAQKKKYKIGKSLVFTTFTHSVFFVIISPP